VSLVFVKKLPDHAFLTKTPTKISYVRAASMRLDDWMALSIAFH
jgi:hypothetical protein